MLRRYKKQLITAGVSCALVLAAFLIPLKSDAQLTNYNSNESDYSIKSCGNPSLTEDRPNATEIEPEDPAPLADISGDGIDFQLDQSAQGTRAALQNPIVRPNLFPDSPREGELLDVFAENRYFTTLPENMYTTWCVNGITQQGIVAGGEKITETVEGSPVGPCCNAATRTPAKDEDKDGIDDDWEAFYFLGKTINGVTYTDITQVKPDDDLDNDGYCATSFRKTDSPKGAALTIAPSSITAARQTSDGKQEQAKYATGDCSFPTGEEYIWMTDPTNPDTDADGYPDESDIAGKGQQKFSYTSDKKILGQDELRVTSIGMSQKADVKIDSFARSVIIGKGDPLDINLTQNTKVPRPGESIEITANIKNAQKSADALEYTWAIDGVVVASDRNGFGKNILSIDRASLPTGKKNVKISVHVVEKVTPDIIKDASKEIDVLFGDAFDLTFTPNCSDNGAGNTECAVRNAVIKVSADINSFRGPDFDAATLDQKKTTLDQSELRWYLDDTFQTAGRGVALTQFQFTASKIAGQNHIVRLQVLKKDRTEYASQTLTIPIYGPEVVFATSPALNEKQEIVVRPGAQVVITATPHNFQPANTEFSFAWNLDDELTQLRDIQSPGNRLIFTTEQAGHIYNARMLIKGIPQGPNTSGQGEQASASVRIRVQDPATQAQAQTQARGVSNQVSNQARSLVASVFRFVRNAVASSFSAIAHK